MTISLFIFLVTMVVNLLQITVYSLQRVTYFPEKLSSYLFLVVGNVLQAMGHVEVILNFPAKICFCYCNTAVKSKRFDFAAMLQQHYFMLEAAKLFLKPFFFLTLATQLIALQAQEYYFIRITNFFLHFRIFLFTRFQIPGTIFC